MGSRPSKQEPEHGPATRRGHEVKWHYLPQPVYVRAFGGVGAERTRLAPPVRRTRLSPPAPPHPQLGECAGPPAYFRYTVSAPRGFRRTRAPRRARPPSASTTARSMRWRGSWPRGSPRPWTTWRRSGRRCARSVLAAGWPGAQVFDGRPRAQVKDMMVAVVDQENQRVQVSALAGAGVGVLRGHGDRPDRAVLDRSQQRYGRDGN